MWVLGYKVEGPATNFEAVDGARLEVLGGVANQFGWHDRQQWPMLRIDQARAAYVGCTNGPSASVGFETLVEEVTEQGTRRFPRDGFPRRPGRHGQYTVPLYVTPDGE